MPSMKGKLGVGIVGLSARGGWASMAHVPALRSMPDCFHINGLSASTPESARAAAEIHNVEFYTDDPEELVYRAGVDIVVVAVKVPHHQELVSHALNAGKAVYCEWPLGKDINDAVVMHDLARERGVRHFVGLQGRSAPALVYLHHLINTGSIGNIISTTMIASCGFPWAGTANAGTAYALDAALGATMLTIPFGHGIDALRWVLGGFESIGSTLATRHKRVSLIDTGEVVAATGPDQVAITGVLTSGAVAVIHFRGDIFPGPSLRWEIIGDKGSLLIESDIGHIQYGFLTIQRAGLNGKFEQLSVPHKFRRAKTMSSDISDTVAHAYKGVYDDIKTESNTIPNFSVGLELHYLINRIAEAANQ